MGFWKTLGKIGAFAAPFALAPFTGGTSLLATLGKVGVGAGSALLGSALSGGSGGVKNTSGLLDEQQAGLRQTRETATGLMPQANALLQQSSQSFSPVIQHYAGLLSGDRGRAMGELSPEVQRINQGYDANARNANALAPRGGGRTAFNSELPYERTRDINNLLSSSRSTGAQGLLQAGSAAGSQGSNLYSSILSGLAGASSGGNSLLNYDLQAKAQQSQRNQQLGQQIYSILGPLLGSFGGDRDGGGGSGGNSGGSTPPGRGGSWG